MNHPALLRFAYFLTGSAAACLASAAHAGETAAGAGPTGAPVPETAVTVQALEADTLATLQYPDVMRALKLLPGVYLQEEEGFGLRPNIAVRGHDLYRSAGLAITEDGVPAAPAPYAAPQAFYFPTFRRMTAATVLSGPASLAQGTRTTGGGLDLVSSAIPERFGGFANASFNEIEFAELIAQVGDSGERWGWMAETAQLVNHGFRVLESDPGAKTGYALSDYLLKLRLDGDPDAPLRQSLELTLGHTGQDGWDTYLGLTGPDFRADPLRRYAGSQHDRLESSHQQYRARYALAPAGGDWRLELTAYRRDFEQSWYRLDTVNGAGIAAILADPGGYAQELDWIRGANSPDDALVLRDYDSDYYAQGLMAAFSWRSELGGAQIDWLASLLAHEDREDRLHRADGYRMEDQALVLTRAGAPGSAANLVSDARALVGVIRADVQRGDLVLSPVLRLEKVDLQRREYALDDPARAGSALRTTDDSVSQILPGLGARYRLAGPWALFAGLHKGFSAPLPGSGSQGEESLNLSAGLRYQSAATSGEFAGFVTDYDNLLATCQDYQVGFCPIDSQTEYGKSRISGIIASLGQVFPNIGQIGLAFNWDLSYTYTHEAVFLQEFAGNDGAWGAVAKGDELPYIPEHQLHLRAGLQQNKWGFYLIGNYTGEARAQPGQGGIAPGEGTEALAILDLLADYRVSPDLRVYVKIDNVTDETGVLALRPAGARGPAPSAFGVGVHYTF